MEESGLWNNARSSRYIRLVFRCEDLGRQEGALPAFDRVESQPRWLKVLGPAGNVERFFSTPDLEMKQINKYRILRKEIHICRVNFKVLLSRFVLVYFRVLSPDWLSIYLVCNHC